MDVRTGAEVFLRAFLCIIDSMKQERIETDQAHNLFFGSIEIGLTWLYTRWNSATTWRGDDCIIHSIISPTNRP